MDKSWMNLRGRFLPKYIRGVKKFIDFARPHADRSNRILCPCKNCNNRWSLHIVDVEQHLNDAGMDKSYTRREFHGEGIEVMSEDDDEDDVIGGQETHGDVSVASEIAFFLVV